MATELNLDEYVDKIIAKAEGKKAHKGQEKAETKAYGLTAAATEGRPKKENESDRDYAKRIIKDKYVKEVKEKLGTDVWNKMPESMKAVAVDVHYNAGLGGNPSFVKSLKDGDYPAALKNTLDIVGVTIDGTQYTSTGLAKRRASIYNVGAAGLGLPLITDTLTTKQDGNKSQVSYFTGEGNDVLFSLDFNKPLAPTSTEGWRNPIDYGFKASNIVPADRLTPQQMERAVQPNSSILDKVKRGVGSLIPSAQAEELPVRGQPTYDYIPQQAEPQYATMEDLLMDKGLMRNPLLFDDKTADQMWRQF